MRDIKFRVWNTETNKMIINVKEMGVFALQSIYSIDEFLAIPTNEKYPLMQYTGLKDKNGVEIYEGDYMQDGHSGRWAEVKFINGAFVVEFDNEIQDLYDWTYECIIGNIYKNKELLND